MLQADLPEFAARGNRGIDLFRRVADAEQNRVGFECLACWRADDGPVARDAPGQWQIYRPSTGLRPRAKAALARFWANPALHTRFALGDAARYPRAENPQARLEMLQYLEFQRSRMVAGIALSLYEEKLERDAALAVRDHAETANTLKLLLDYNLLDRAGAVLERAAAPVIARARAPGFSDSGDQMTGFALRLMGDLHLRRDEPAAALGCFEAALLAGDNPFRRRRAIEAARALNAPKAARPHLQALMRDGALPRDLAGLQAWSEGRAEAP